MKKISVIGATLAAAAMLCAAPISLQLSQDKGLSLSVNKAGAVVGRPLTPGSIAGVHRRHERREYRRGSYGHELMATDIMATAARSAAASLTCKEAAKLQFPTERKSRRAYKQECKQAWKAQNGHKA